MKRDFLEKLEIDGKKLDKESIESIMLEHGKAIEDYKTSVATKNQEITNLKTERDGLKTQIKERDKDIKTLKEQKGSTEEINKKLEDLQLKYDNDTKDLQDKISSQNISHATEKFFDQFEFASNLAKKAAIAEFKEANLKFDEESKTFLGGNDFVEKLKTTDPTAFKQKQEPEPKPKPKFGGRSDGDGDKKFSLTELMKLKNENPETKIEF